MGCWRKLWGLQRNKLETQQGDLMGELQSLKLDIEYVLDLRASPDELASVTQIALEEGVPGQVRAALSQKSIEDVAWTVLILTPIVPFLKGFMEEAGRSSYKDLRRLVTRLIAAGKRGKGHVEVMERDSLTTIVFPPDLPEEAFEQLTKLGLENIAGNYWMWDSTTKCWIYQSTHGE